MGKYRNKSESEWKEWKHVNVPSGEESLITLIQVRVCFFSAMLLKEVNLHPQNDKQKSELHIPAFFTQFSEFPMFSNLFHIWRFCNEYLARKAHAYNKLMERERENMCSQTHAALHQQLFWIMCRCDCLCLFVWVGHPSGELMTCPSDCWERVEPRCDPGWQLLRRTRGLSNAACNYISNTDLCINMEFQNIFIV